MDLKILPIGNISRQTVHDGFTMTLRLLQWKSSTSQSDNLQDRKPIAKNFAKFEQASYCKLDCVNHISIQKIQKVTFVFMVQSSNW